LALPAITAAYAGDPYGGFGPSDGASQEVGSNPRQCRAGAGRRPALPWLQQQSQNQPDNSGAWDQQGAGAVDDGSNADDASGH
jgi:hypothetical protein